MQLSGKHFKHSKPFHFLKNKDITEDISFKSIIETNTRANPNGNATGLSCILNIEWEGHFPNHYVHSIEDDILSLKTMQATRIIDLKNE